MFKESLQKELEKYRKKNETVAMAMVVRRDAPTSGKPGDKALINAKGEVSGWIGGGCTKGIVIKEAMAAINEKSPRLVKIQPAEDTPDQNGVKNYKMTCMSGGALEVYIEPVMPTTTIRIFGRSHIARALCEIGAASGFSIEIVSSFPDEEMFPSASRIVKLNEFETGNYVNDFTVVCTQGEDDESHLMAAIGTNPFYLGFVASMKKANSIILSLKRQGIPHESLVKIKTPAGLDINAKTPEEVAISILAQIIQSKRDATGKKGESAHVVEQNEITDDLYINPVCKIPVQKSSAKHILEYNGEKVYFCCDGCKTSFKKEPEAYMS